MTPSSPRAITPAQVEELVSLLERLSEARKTRAVSGQTQSPDEIIHDPQRRELADHLYALSDEARGELIVLMLIGRGGVDHSYEEALGKRPNSATPAGEAHYL